MTSLLPLGDRVLIEIDLPSMLLASGLYLAPSAVERSRTGVVLAVGEGNPVSSGERVPLPVNVGDRVIFSPWAGYDLAVNEILRPTGAERCLIESRDLLAIIPSDADVG